MNFAGAEARIRRRSFRGKLGHQHADLITTELESAARRIVDRCQIPAGIGGARGQCGMLDVEDADGGSGNPPRCGDG
jgi:hypothetical protein